MYAYAEFETRVYACHSFLRSILEFVRKSGPEMRDLVRKADQEAAAGTARRFFRDFELTALEEPITIQGYKMTTGEGRSAASRRPLTDPADREPADFTVPYLARFKPLGEGKPLPEHGYVFPRGHIGVREKLAQHGIRVNEIADDTPAMVEVFEIEEIEASERIFQGHRTHELKGSWVEKELVIPAGSSFVPTAQPLSMLAAYLLEPESRDGLAHWNYMDRFITVGTFNASPAPYPVWRW
jgi:hypothetical protein